MCRTAAIFMLLATVGALAACGSTSHVTATTVVGAQAVRGAHAGSRTGGADRPFTKAQANAFVRAVILRAGDLPGFRVSTEHEHETATEKHLTGEMVGCIGGGGFTKGLAAASSQHFERETGAFDQGVHSEVTVAQTAAMAARELALIRGKRARACMSHFFGLIFKGVQYRGATFGLVAISQGFPPAAGTAGSFGWRVTAALRLHGLQIPIYVDIVGFVYGPAEITLFSSGAPEQFPAATERRLYALLVKRARAAVPV